MESFSCCRNYLTVIQNTYTNDDCAFIDQNPPARCNHPTANTWRDLDIWCPHFGHQYHRLCLDLHFLQLTAGQESIIGDNYIIMLAATCTSGSTYPKLQLAKICVWGHSTYFTMATAWFHKYAVGWTDIHICQHTHTRNEDREVAVGPAGHAVCTCPGGKNASPKACMNWVGWHLVCKW